MAVCVKQNSRWSSDFVFFLVESQQSLFGQDQATDDKKNIATYKFDTVHIQLDR